MKYTEELALKLVQKYGIAKSTHLNWKKNKIIPDMYAEENVEKINNFLRRPVHKGGRSGGRPPSGRSGVVRSYYIKPHLVAALDELDINKNNFVNEAISEKLRRLKLPT